ncbi:MAG: hypothetical protein GWP19_00780 [Planctomycetia bacterium]|nr:hypothetical protein [Planctomycetia bacterium]
MKNYELQSSNDSNPATYKQLKWLLSYSNVTSDVSISQLMKRFPIEDFQDLIDSAKSGEEIEITG